ncbi:FHA domain-containing protein [Caenorhabditis elegans]|uniref:FHA domain-containing protein n=1 Tax=Caenorhabditis elegans TaxID=6239 RepID=A0A2K5ATP9_CAEEL|nr:FHA domain-containing protein [Caenorhabditis elegans]SPC47286.1 FHA domain-containing protein [Caenorhabditis elegans]|eukprot:NP_001348699.1 Nijmegen Breakage Syndrome homolog [Caenorhabditis elegans]
MPINGIKIKNSSGEEVYVLKEKGSVVNFGREKKVCHITFDPHAARVSRIHASIEWGDEGLFFTDKSKEGTEINGTRLKQSSQELHEGVYQLAIGGISMTLEVDGDELEETVIDSPQPDESSTVPETVYEESRYSNSSIKEMPAVEVTDDDFDDVSSISTFNITKFNPSSIRKRKPEGDVFSIDRPRGKRGPISYRPRMNFDDEMENRGSRGPRARKADKSGVFDEEAPAKKAKIAPQASQSLIKKPKAPSAVEPDDVESIVSQVAALPSVSREPEEESDDSDLSDRGPAALNETIKYCNLIFQQPNSFKKNETTFDSNVPNFKRFVPKGLRDGRTSAISMHSTTTCNTTISMVDSRIVH